MRVYYKFSAYSLFLGALIFLLVCLGCSEKTKLEPCDPDKGKFVGGQHFIDSSFFNDEKKIDYIKMWKRFENRLSFTPACIPIEKRKTLEEVLGEEEKAADLSR